MYILDEFARCSFNLALLLEGASAAVRKALRDPDPGNRSASEAPDDPDLAVLRESDPQLFQELNAKNEESKQDE